MYKEVCIDSIISVLITYNIAKTIVNFDTKRLKYWPNDLASVLRKLKMRNSCKKENADCSVRQVCYLQICYDLFTTSCCNSVHSIIAAVLWQQDAAGLFPTALLQFCHNSLHQIWRQSVAGMWRQAASDMRPVDGIPQQADNRPAATCANLARTCSLSHAAICIFLFDFVYLIDLPVILLVLNINIKQWHNDNR